MATRVALAFLITVLTATWSRPTAMRLRQQLAGWLVRRERVLSRWKGVLNASYRHVIAFTKVSLEEWNKGSSSVPFMYIIPQNLYLF